MKRIKLIKQPYTRRQLYEISQVAHGWFVAVVPESAAILYFLNLERILVRTFYCSLMVFLNGFIHLLFMKTQLVKNRFC